MSMKTSQTQLQRCWGALLGLGLCVALVPACEDDGGYDEGYETGDYGDDGETGEPPPPVGFRVYPRVETLEVSAVVSYEANGVVPETCMLDEQGGYLCDVGDFPGPTVTIRVERSGFEPAVRQVEIQPYQVLPLDVHLLPEGAGFGAWSECAEVSLHESCATVCETFVLGSCYVAGCETNDPQDPNATMQTFSDADCSTVPLENVVDVCEQDLPEPGQTVAVRCCCTG
jgi:hypothetical protein